MRRSKSLISEESDINLSLITKTDLRDFRNTENHFSSNTRGNCFDKKRGGIRTAPSFTKTQINLNEIESICVHDFCPCVHEII